MVTLRDVRIVTPPLRLGVLDGIEFVEEELGFGVHPHEHILGGLGLLADSLDPLDDALGDVEQGDRGQSSRGGALEVHVLEPGFYDYLVRSLQLYGYPVHLLSTDQEVQVEVHVLEVVVDVFESLGEVLEQDVGKLGLQ